MVEIFVWQFYMKSLNPPLSRTLDSKVIDNFLPIDSEKTGLPIKRV